jgi:serine protease Do
MAASLGTGVIISSTGSILTNAHIVQKQSALEVQWSNGSRGMAKVIGIDAKSDLALLQLTAGAPNKCKPARLGDSDQLQTGEWVIALGNPFGQAVTASVGIVSAKERQDQPLGQLGLGMWGLIQTDVNINPGNSGGPLVNAIGEVVGISLAIDSETNGIGFAVPINTARKLLPLLAKEGKVVRPWIGIYMDQVTEELAQKVGLKQPKGALVASVVAQGPAERAGLRAGDIILSFNGHDLESYRELPGIASVAGINQPLLVKVWRNQEVLSFTLKSEPMPE